MSDIDTDYLLTLKDKITSNANQIGALITDEDEQIISLLNEIVECAKSIALTIE